MLYLIDYTHIIGENTKFALIFKVETIRVQRNFDGLFCNYLGPAPQIRTVSLHSPPPLGVLRCKTRETLQSYPGCNQIFVHLISHC